MDLPLASSAFTGSKEPITTWDATRLSRARHESNAAGLHQIIDQLGIGSKVAQGLNHTLTTVQKLRENPTHRLYLLCGERSAIGIIKVGVKKLFIRRRNGQLVEMEPLCVLDFYIHEKEQRSGFGRVLFEFMLQQESIQPSRLAIDRPSPKFLGFLKKHYGLADFEAQTNNFVVFNQYFESSAAPHHTETPAALGRHSLSQQQHQCHPSSATLNASRVSAGKMIADPSASCAASMVPLVGVHVNAPSRTLAGSAACFSETLPMKGSSAFVQPPNAVPHYQLSHGGASSREIALSSAGRRTNSPTRSAVGYNIITLANEGAGDSAQGLLSRSAVVGRRSSRPF